MEFKRGQKYKDKHGQKWIAVIRRGNRPMLQKLGKFGSRTPMFGNWFKGQGLVEIK